MVATPAKGTVTNRYSGRYDRTIVLQRKPPLRTRSLRPLVLLAFLLPALSCAADEGAARSAWEGTLGIGPFFVPDYVGGKGRRVVAAPLVDASYDDRFRMELFRGTAYLAASEDRKLGLGLAVEPRFYGFKPSDAARLGGMAARKDTAEGGLSLDWAAPWMDINVAWFGDLMHTARGTSLNATVEKALVDGARWSLSALAGVDRISSQTTNYYFGVRPEEATALRPRYQAGAATNQLAGLKGAFHLDDDRAIVFGTYLTRLGTAAAASPIVETRQARFFWLGYALDL